MDGQVLGRDAELAALSAARARSRVTRVSGPPGVGKSALVACWAAREGDVILCRVEGIATRAEVEAKIAQALEVPLPKSGVADLLAGQGEACLVLDGVDLVPQHELAAAMREWLQHAPSLRLVTTAQAIVPGESVVLAPLPADVAYALFVDRARSVGYAPRDSAEERRSIEELVDRLDRLPLAIVLAAARAGVLSPLQIGQRLADDLDLPGGSLRGALDLSWSMLSALERRVLATASALRGPFQVTLLEAVLDEPDVLIAFESLVAKSLVQRTDEGRLSVWFRLLETVRRYAATAQEPSISRSTFDTRIVARAEALAAMLDTKDEALAVEELAALADDLTFVVRSDPALASRAGMALAAWGLPRGMIALDVLEATARAASPADSMRARYWLARGLHRAGAVDAARREVELALQAARGEPSKIRAQLEILQSQLHLERGEHEAVPPLLESALARLDGLGEWALEGDIANMRGRLAEARSELPEAAAGFLAARALYRRAGALRLAGRALQNLAVVRDAEGRWEEARARFEEALAEHALAGDPAGVADNLMNTGSLCVNAGDLEAAEDLTRRALDEERRLGNRRVEGLALANLALIAHLRGDLAAARRDYLGALAIFEETQERRFAAVIGLMAAAVQAEAGARSEAVRGFAAAEQELTRQGDAAQLLVLRTLEALLLPRAEAEARLQTARAALGAGAKRSQELALAERIVTRALAPAATQPPAKASVLLGPRGLWFERDGARVELGTRPALRQVLVALAEAATPLPQEALFHAGWPGERVLPLAARDRVYTAVRTLRKLGLDGVLSRSDDGYYLQADVHVASA